MSDEISIPLSLPLDEDGILRRDCPTCEREFKCLVSQEEGDSIEDLREKLREGLDVVVGQVPE